MIDSKEITDYCRRYYGYGKLNSEIAVIGIEEGEKKEYHTLERAKKRIKTTLSLLDKSGSPLIDFVEAHKIHSPEQYKKIISYNGSFSPYWNKATRVIMGFDGKDVETPKNVMKYFCEVVLKKTVMLDFRPLFSTDIKTWKYKNWSNLEQLKSREKYYEWIDSFRIKKIRQLIAENNFKAVLFFGISEEDQFGEIIGLNFNDSQTIDYNGKSFGGSYLKILKDRNTNYFLMPQPTSVGASNDFFNWVGSEIKKNIKTTN